MRLRPRSIGARLTIWYTAAFSVSVMLLAVAMWLAVQQGLYHAIDESLRDRAEGIRIFIEDHKTRLGQDEVKEEFRAHGEFFQVVDEQGNWVHRTEGMPATLEPDADRPGAEPEFSNVTTNGVPLRLFSASIQVDGHVYSMHVAAPLSEVQQGLSDALWMLAPVFPAVLLLASAGGYWISRRALAPVDEITSTAKLITAEHLSQRLTVPTGGGRAATPVGDPQ